MFSFFLSNVNTELSNVNDTLFHATIFYLLQLNLHRKATVVENRK